MKKTNALLWIVLAIVFVFPLSASAGTSVQLHTEFDRDPGNQELFTATFEHFSTWDYGKNFFFIDFMGENNFQSEAGLIYFEYSYYFSLEKIFDWELPFDFISDTYLAGQYNDGDKESIDRALLYGLSVDLDIGVDSLSLSFYYKDYDEGADSYQATLCWTENFKLFGSDFIFKGFADYWISSDRQTFISEPQLKFPLSNLGFVKKGSFLDRSNIGTEIEISHNFFGADYGWQVNPTIFWEFMF